MNYDRPAHRIDNAIATPKPLSFKFPARSKIKFALVINNTLASFPALNALKVDLIETLDKGRRINPRRFDDLVEQITGQPAEAHVIVDTGSSAFVPLLHYMVSNEMLAILSQGGNQLVVHTVVPGGHALLETLHGAAQLVKQMDAARFVIWLNPFWGQVVGQVADNGRSFEQMNVNEATAKQPSKSLPFHHIYIGTSCCATRPRSQRTRAASASAHLKHVSRPSKRQRLSSKPSGSAQVVNRAPGRNA